MQIEILKIMETGEIIHLPYRDVKLQTNGLAIVKGANGLYGLLNMNGEEIVPPQYLSIDNSRSDGLIIVQAKNKLWGIINEKGEEIISPKYQGIGEFKSNGLAKI